MKAYLLKTFVFVYLFVFLIANGFLHYDEVTAAPHHWYWLLLSWRYWVAIFLVDLYVYVRVRYDNQDNY